MVKASFSKHAGLAVVAICAGANVAHADSVGTAPGAALTPPYHSVSDDSMFLAGGQAGANNASYGYAGVITALPGSSVGNGWVERIFAEELTYRYKKDLPPSAAKESIDGTGYGAVVTFGYQHSYDSGWFGLYAGPAFRHTNLSPDDRGNDARGNEVTARLQAEGEQYLGSDAKLNLGASYDAFDNNSYWGRARALVRVSGPVFFGPEGSYQGDNDYKSWEGGLALVGFQLTDQSSIGFDGGVEKTNGEPLGGYGGLEFGANF